MRFEGRTVDEDDRLVEVLVRLDALEVAQLAVLDARVGYELAVVQLAAREGADLAVEAVLDLEHPADRRPVHGEEAREEGDLEVG